jgi:hypothetical protein
VREAEVGLERAAIHRELHERGCSCG